MGFALSEAIDNWKDLIEKNHETEASRSLRKTADDILKMCRTLKDQFDNMRYCRTPLPQTMPFKTDIDKQQYRIANVNLLFSKGCPK